MNEAKSIWKSRTFWFNVLTVGAAILGHATDILPESADKYIIPVLGAVNLLLRYLTVQPVSVTGGK